MRETSKGKGGSAAGRRRGGRAPWVRLDPIRERFVCERCGGTKGIALPATVLEYTAAVDGFMQTHAACVESPK